ncbi:MAG TPA: LysM peptidoglycan-binding domain-containing protein [Clostridiales bacterium]|nr:LysM peptidoglycan-binding domain-containing protein [Clostridiales bacterium]
MQIYVVQQGDTIDLIANKFGMSIERLIIDNGIKEPSSLVVGQSLVIAFPEIIYTVREGDTLAGIASQFNITVMQLLRYNPYLANRKYIYPGETLVISYDNRHGSLLSVGYTYSFINDGVLRMTLPNLTQLLILNYRIADHGEFVGNDEDISAIRLAKSFGTEAILIATGHSASGEINVEMVYEMLLSPQVQDKLIENLLNILKTKGYNGVDMTFQLINTANQKLYLNFLTRISNRLHPEGYSVFLTVNPGLSFNGNEVTFEKINYSSFSEVSDGILFLAYDWGSIRKPPAQFSIFTTPSLLDYITAQVPLNKIRIAIPTLGYDWPLPYVDGKSRASVLNFDSVLSLARQMNAVIHFDEASLSAYFEYTDFGDVKHIVWFKDARSIDSSLKILKKYGITGIGVWNIMYYFNQMWLVINSQYQIEKV